MSHIASIPSGYAHPLPPGCAIKGYADLSGYAHPLPPGSTIGGDVYLRGYAHPLPPGCTIGGTAYLSGYAHPLPLGCTIWGTADLRDYAHPHSVRQVTRSEAAHTYMQAVLRTGHLLADGILAKVIGSPKAIDEDLDLYMVRISGQSRDSYAVVKRGTAIAAHGDTALEARVDLLYKLSDRTLDEWRTTPRSLPLPFSEAIGVYRAVTGACASGCKHFVRGQALSADDSYSIEDIARLTRGAYGAEAFAAFAASLRS